MGLVLRERAATLEFLLTLRSREILAHAGQVCLPGGTVDADETVFQALDRELEEEVGLTQGSIEWAPSPWENLPSRYGLHVAPFLGFYEGSSSALTLSEAEVADAAWLPLADLFDETRWDVRTLVRMPELGEEKSPGGALDSPLWYGWKHVTWGLTAAFLAYFVRRISGRPPIGLQFRRKI